MSVEFIGIRYILTNSIILSGWHCLILPQSLSLVYFLFDNLLKNFYEENNIFFGVMCCGNRDDGIV
jgi:hypothetical protein